MRASVEVTLVMAEYEAHCLQKVLEHCSGKARELGTMGPDICEKVSDTLKTALTDIGWTQKD